ncbi:MAG: ribosome-associated translation inhibitor RaiA [Candidatus Hydrogenedentota bacterium]|nr:MAG: ribosome-associated translation inhibitor RaiA [Candidatus Hydrogenedentota bacterium]
MNISVYFKNLEKTDAIQNYIEEKLKNMASLFHHIEAVDVRFFLERQYQVCEITVHADAKVFHIRKKNKDLYAAIDAALDALHVQVDKHHKKMDRRSHEYDRRAVLPSVPEIPEGEEVLLTVYEASAKPMDDLEAILQLRAGRFRFIMYHHINEKKFSIAYQRPDGNYSIITPAKEEGQYAEHIVKFQDNQLKELSVAVYPMDRMTVAEAIEALKENNLEFLAFINEETSKMNVLFQTKHGDLALKRPPA